LIPNGITTGDTNPIIRPKTNTFFYVDRLLNDSVAELMIPDIKKYLKIKYD